MFYQKFSKLPTRAEKEPLRPLYMYYKKLKQGIDNMKNKRKASVNNSTKEEELKKAALIVNTQQQRRSCDATNNQLLRSENVSEFDDDRFSHHRLSNNDSAVLSNNSSQSNFKRLARKHLQEYSHNSHRESKNAVKPLGESNSK